MIHSSWPCRTAGHVRVLDDVRAGVGRGQGDRDDEVGEGEPEQAEHEELAAPERQQPLEHGDRALAVRALRGHPAVDRQRAEQGEQHQDQRGQRAEQPGGQERDAGLVAEGGEVVDAGQAHDLPPGVRLLAGVLVGVRSGVPGVVVGRWNSHSRKRPGRARRLEFDTHTSIQPAATRFGPRPNDSLTPGRSRLSGRRKDRRPGVRILSGPSASASAARLTGRAWRQRVIDRRGRRPVRDRRRRAVPPDGGLVAVGLPTGAYGVALCSSPRRSLRRRRWTDRRPRCSG